MSGFRRVAEKELYRGSLISVAEGTFTAPDGSTFSRDVVRHPGAVSVVPVLGETDEVLLLRQYRAPIDRDLLEIPAGKRDVSGEPPEATARRELAEVKVRSAGDADRGQHRHHSPRAAARPFSVARYSTSLILVADDVNQPRSTNRSYFLRSLFPAVYLRQPSAII